MKEKTLESNWDFVYIYAAQNHQVCIIESRHDCVKEVCKKKQTRQQGNVT